MLKDVVAVGGAGVVVGVTGVAGGVEEGPARGVRQATVTVRGGWPEGAPERRMVLLPSSSVGWWSDGQARPGRSARWKPTDAPCLDLLRRGDVVAFARQCVRWAEPREFCVCARLADV
ncbi:hypothetical protein [Streptomyces sp. NPDC058086]|uniref:hypothetical protein n=1 Tax=Streptomyces sp. NPDC058086 TaxID=3346334 RepID=UPI0036ED2D08